MLIFVENLILRSNASGHEPSSRKPPQQARIPPGELPGELPEQVAGPVVERLPGELLEKIDNPDALRKAVTQWSVYPDSFDGFEQDAELIGPGGLALLERYNVKRRMLYGHRGAGFCAEHGYPLLEAAFDYAQTGNPESRLARQRHLAKLGAWGVVYTLRDTAPDPRQTPVVLFIANRLRSYAGIDGKRIEANLAAYRASGGRLVWIGENAPPAVFPELGGPPSGQIPEQWPKEPGGVAGWKLLLAAPAQTSWPLLRSPQTPAGWRRPACPQVLAADPARGTEPLLDFAAEGRQATVGVVCVGSASNDERRLGKAAILPTVAIHPYLFDNRCADGPLADVQLDAVGRRVLMETLRRIERK